MQLCLASGDLSTVTPLTRPELISPDCSYETDLATVDTPETLAWSPDDRTIAFSRVEWFEVPDGERLPGTALWLYHVDTSATEPLAIHKKREEEEEPAPYYFRAPRWSPDGRRVAYLGEHPDGRTDLYVRVLSATRANETPHRFDRYENVGWPAWSPDGRRLAFRQGILRAITANPVEAIRVLAPGTADAGDVLRVRPADCAGLLGGSTGGGTRPMPRLAGIAWSPDGNLLASALIPDGETPERGAIITVQTDLHTAERDPRSQASVVLSSAGYAAPVWISQDRLGCIRIASGRVEAIASPLSGFPSVLCSLPSSDLDWSPDRRRFVCVAPDKQKPGARCTLQVIPTGL